MQGATQRRRRQMQAGHEKGRPRAAFIEAQGSLQFGALAAAEAAAAGAFGSSNLPPEPLTM